MKKICFVVDSIFSYGGVQRVTAVIAKELAKNHEVSVVTFDKPNEDGTDPYGIKETNINYHYFEYPKIGKYKKKICRYYSGYYQRFQPQSKWSSDLYACSSFPSEQRDALLEELKRGKYDVIIGVHAP
jgi:glycosyltransferase involved in cell wall biosynthesis